MIRGTVQSVLFQNPENGYSVLKLRTEGGELVTVVGTIPMTIVGERLVIAGRWGHHPNHGQQFEAEFLERLMPETKGGDFFVPFLPCGQGHRREDGGEDCFAFWRVELGCVRE